MAKNQKYFCRMRKPKNKLLKEVEVSGYAAEGKSLAKIDGKVYFIEGAAF